MRLVRSGLAPKHGRFVADEQGVMLELYDDAGDRHLDLRGLGEVTFHLALISSDLDVDIARLVQAGAELAEPIKTTDRGDRLAFVRDPFGLTLQLAQRVRPVV
jgi:uncharacterized glyoxalase superfamily protein PhnB